ncbi:MAG: hypothetical protein ABJP91_15760 [Sneathiella sp.]
MPDWITLERATIMILFLITLYLFANQNAANEYIEDVESRVIDAEINITNNSENMEDLQSSFESSLGSLEYSIEENKEEIDDIEDRVDILAIESHSH